MQHDDHVRRRQHWLNGLHGLASATDMTRPWITVAIWESTTYELPYYSDLKDFAK